MKRITPIILLVALLFSGCMSSRLITPMAAVNTVLDAILPRDFSGPVSWTGNLNGGVVSIAATNVHHTETGWTWTYFRMADTSPLHGGILELGTRPSGQ